MQSDLNETVSPIKIFSLVTGPEVLLVDSEVLIVEQSNLYAHQNGRNFTITKEELKAFLGINFVVAINKLPTIAVYWRVDNDGIHLRHFLHFANNRKVDKTDKAFKMRPVIDQLNSRFSKVLSNDNRQSIDEHIVNFKGRSGIMQYIKSKPIKWGFKFCFHTSEFNLGLGEEVVLQLAKDLERSFYFVCFDNVANCPKLIESLFQKGIVILEQFEPTESKCQK